MLRESADVVELGRIFRSTGAETAFDLLAADDVAIMLE